MLFSVIDREATVLLLHFSLRLICIDSEFTKTCPLRRWNEAVNGLLEIIHFFLLKIDVITSIYNLVPKVDS